MAVKVFLTGATGYIGGTALDHVYRAHPDYEYTLLVRDEKRGEQIKAKYPTVKFVYGTLENSPIVRDAAAAADIVIHTADSSDNVPGASAISKGIKEGHSADKPGYWIHVSGTNILSWYDEQNGREGEAPLPEQAYNDIDGIERILTIPDQADHRNVDIMVQDSVSDAVRVAIICPPTIYGKGGGAVSTRSAQVPGLVNKALKSGFVPIYGKGKTEWDHVNVHDLGDMFVRLVDATQDPSKNSNPEIFGRNGYFFTQGGSHVWADVAKMVAEEVHRQKYTAKPETRMVTEKEMGWKEGQERSTYGINSKGVGLRAKKYLGWEPKGASIKETLAELVAAEAKELGVKPLYG